MGALQSAVWEDNRNVTEYPINQGADVKQATPDGRTSIGRHKATKAIPIHGANIVRKDKDGYSALHSAAQKGHLDVTKNLIGKGAEVDKGDNEGRTALHNAAQEGHLEVTKYLIGKGAEMDKGDNEGRTALHNAAQEGHLEVTKYLIGKGAEVNKGDNEGTTALQIAAFIGHLDVTKYLNGKGAEVDKGDNEGRTALHSAAQGGHLDVTKYLIGKGAEVDYGDNEGRTALHSAAQEGHLEVTKYLIGKGAEVNKGDNEGRTALRNAAFNGNLDVTKYLIGKGAEVNKGDNEDIRALRSAAQEGHLDVTNLLIGQEAEVDKGSIEGWSALHSAACNGHLDVTKYLIGKGAEVNKGDNEGWTALICAAFIGRLDVTKYLIGKGAELDKEDNEGRTALCSAAQEGHLDVTKYLIGKGAEVNKGDHEGRTALQIAAFNGHIDVTKYLIGKGAEVNKGLIEGWTPLHSAACNGHIDITKCLIGKGAEVNKGDNEGRTALQSAAFNDHPEVTKYLIGQGAEVNKGDNNGKTALRGAAQKGYLDITKCLIGKGAEVNNGDNEGRTALHGAAFNGHLDVTKYLIGKGADVNKGDIEGWTAFKSAAHKGHLDVTKYLIGKGAEVNKGDNEGRTALHSAAQVGHLDVTKYLIAQGAEVNKGDNEGSTALHDAAFNGHHDVTKYLIDKGAEVNKGNIEGWTAFKSAAQEGHLEVTKYLIGKGAEVNKVDNEGRTALHSAAQGGHLDVTKYLISQGAEVNKGLIEGWTALHSAACNGHHGVTKYLIGKGAEVNKGDNEGRTALHGAAFNGHLDVTKYLIGKGAELNKGDDDGRTPLHYAVENGYTDVVKVLLAGGARFDKGDQFGLTPLHLSSFFGYQSIADLFIDRSNSKLAQNDSSEIHLAIQHGHTSVIEKLVSEGADLNVQSTNGQTCLHKAIKLCYKTDRIVQETNTLQKISDKYYMGELSPERALVFYLLENGAKLDVKDETGNLPIQYAKDEVLKQMILWRLASLDEIPSFRDEPSTPTIVSAEVERHIRQEIELEGLGVSMLIPPEAVHQSDPCKITLALLRDPPRDDIQDDESVACYGIRCDPPNMIFHKPAKIRIPHSTLAINPDQVKPYIVSKVWDSVNDLPKTSRNRSSSSPSKLPYCRIDERHLELYIGHCAEWWVLIPLEQQVIRHQLMCTPYIPETVERGKKIEVHLHVHADVPGIDTEVLHDEKHLSYRKAHHSVPFSMISNSGDVTVARDCEGRIAETKLISLKEIHHPMRHNVVLKVPPSEDDTPFEVITITLTQSGNLGNSRSMTFGIRYEDQTKSPEFTPVIREIERTSRNDLPDVDVHKIAEKLSIDDYYDLGVALGFSIQQLDAMEYKRQKDRHEAIREMLITWKQKQLPNQNVKELLLSILKFAETEAENTNMTDITSTRDISDQDLLQVARQIKGTDFMEIGTKLGFSRNKLENMKHKALQNHKDANVQLLCMWKASQRSVSKATETLKCIMESVLRASTANNTDGSLRMISSATPEKRAKPSEPIEPEDMDTITTSDTERGETNDVLDQCGGTPDSVELLSVAGLVKSLSSLCKLGTALRLNDDLIVGFIDLPSSSVLHKIARQLVDSWFNDLKEEEKEDKFAKLLSEFNILRDETVSSGSEEISKAIGSKTALYNLCHHLTVKPSSVLQIMSTLQLLTFPPDMIGRSALKMLNEWVHQGGTRKRLLEIAQAFRFTDAAVKIAEAMKCQPSYMPFNSHGIIDHNGGELTIDAFGIVVSIPEGAIPRGMRSVVTLCVLTHDTPKLPLREGEVVITPVVEGSLTQELLKPATVVLPHCTNHHERKDDPSVILYTKTGPGTFGRENLTPRTSQILKDKIKFRTRHLQVLALSSTDFQGLQLRCALFQPLFMTPREKPTLRVYILHPYRDYIEDINRKEKSSSVPYCQVTKKFKFSIESTAEDLKISFHDGTKSNKRVIPIKSIINGKCSPLNFELQFSREEKGKKTGHIDILQGSATRAEREVIISIEDEPDYAVDLTDSQGRLQYVSNNLFEIMTDAIHETKDLKSIGNELGFSSASMEKKEDPAVDNVSRSGFGKMLREWRRQVRPSEQVDVLHLALQNAGLGHAADVILHKLSNSGHFTQVRQVWVKRGQSFR